MNRRAVDLLKKIRGPQDTPGLNVVKVTTTEPAPVTFIFEGSNQQAVDIGIFEVPVACYPLKLGDRLLVYPLISTGASQRWGVLVNLNGGLAMATMQSATSLKIDGVDAVYEAARLIIPPFVAIKEAYNRISDYNGGGERSLYSQYTQEDKNDVLRPLEAGDRVAVAPTWDDGVIKYVVINRYS